MSLALGIAIRGVHLAAGVGLAGAAVILLLAGRTDRPTALAWHARVAGAGRWLSLAALLSGVAALAWQAATLEGRAGAALDPGALARVALETRGGQVWLARQALLVLLAAFLAVRVDPRRRLDWLAARAETLLLASLALALTALAGHAATAEGASAMAAAVVHLLAAGAWGGAFVFLADLLRRAATLDGADTRAYAVLTVRRFSRLAPAAIAALAVTGAVSAWAQVGSVAALLGTPQGRLLLAKLAVLAVLLGVAAAGRRTLPALSGEAEPVGRPAMLRVSRLVRAEGVLALVVLFLVAAMTALPPPRHEDPTWPFTFRFTTEPLAQAPVARARALAGSQVAVLGVVAALASLAWRRRRVALAAVAAALLAGGGALALPVLAIDAYPATYRRAAIPYTAGSIAAGLALYRVHCAPCHGVTGGGDGPAGLRLPRPPADLRAPHTAHHTAGDLFWWISHGITPAGMPPFRGILDEEQIWDLVNLVRALGASGESRSLTARIEPERPRIAAPDASFTVGPTPPRSLRDLRGQRAALLVLYTLPASRARLAELAEGYGQLVVTGAEVIAAPRDGGTDGIRQLGASPVILYPVVTGGAGQIAAAYSLFSRMPHAEFLVDRHGYLRAVAAGLGAALPLPALLDEIRRLNDEPAVAPPAAEHVH